MAIKQVPVIDAAEATQSINYAEGEGGGLNQVVQVSGSKTFVLASDDTAFIRDVPEFNSLSAIVEGSNIGMRVQGRHLGGASEDWFDLLPIGNRGELLHWNVSEPGIYHWDLRAVSRIRVVQTSSANDDYRFHGALSALEAPRSDSAMAFGTKGFDIFRGDSDTVTGQWVALLPLTDCVLHENIRFASTAYGQPSQPAGFLSTDEVPAGLTIPGPFDRIKISSGTLLAYRL